MGGSSSQTIGYRYFMGLHMAICHGPVNSINAVYVGKRLLGEGEGTSGITTPITSNATVLINDVNLFGGDQKEGGIYGNLDIELGGSSQGANAYLTSQFGSGTPAFRGVTCVVFRGAPIDIGSVFNLTSFANPEGGGYITAMTPYPKAWAFEVTDIPGGSLNPTKQNINNGSANGAHIIYESLTDPDWGLGYSDADIDLDSFSAAADTLFDEGFGLSLIYSQQSTMEEFIRHVLTHINAVLYPDRQSGKFKLVLIRDDFGDGAGLPVFDESNIASLDFFERPAFAELVNEITINYRKRGDLEDSSITAQDLASIQAQEGIISQTSSFPGIDSADIASRVAVRELRQSSTPLARVRLIANREAWNVNPGDVIKLSWGAYGISEVILRVTAMDYGSLESGLIRIDAIEDVFGLPQNSYITPTDTGWTDTVGPPIVAPSSRLIELPYYVIHTTFTQAEAGAVTSDSAYLQAVTETPSQTTFNVQLNTRIGANDFQPVADGSLTPTAQLANNLNFEDKVNISIVNIKNSNAITPNSYAYLNNEVLRVNSIDLVNNQITIGRGYLDSIPRSHLANDIIYFADGNSAIDPTIYVNGDNVDAKLLTQTSRGILPITNAPTQNITMVGRQSRPYNAAQVRINGQYFPTAFTEEFTIVVTWTHQDRTQQLVVGGQDWYEISLGSPEAGVTYTVEYYNNTTSALLYSEAGLTTTQSSFTPAGGTGTTLDIRIEVYTVRDNEQSLNTFSHVVSYTKPIGIRTLRNASNPTDIRVTQNGDRRITR